MKAVFGLDMARQLVRLLCKATEMLDDLRWMCFGAGNATLA